jgi:transmembrane sensor
MEKRYLTHLIRKLLAGKASPQEKEQLDETWNQSVEDDSYLQSLSDTEREDLRKQMYNQVWQTIRQKEAAKAGSADKKPRVISFTRHPYLAVAASLTLLMVVGAVFYLLKYQSRWQTVSTAFGARKEIVLPDQSVVVLNGNSSIRYAKQWDGQQTREIWLEGEAYFSVQHTHNHQKFIVHTPDQLQVEVLGTKFNVSNRRGDTRVVLQEGKVKVSDLSKNYVMKPGEMVQYSIQRPDFVPVAVNPKPVVSWKDAVRLYRDESIESIMNGLQDSHGIRVEFRNNAIRKELFSGSVPADSVEQIFQKIEKLYSIKVTRKEGVYIIQ